MITNRYHEEGKDIAETTDYSDRYDSIEEAIEDMKEVNEDSIKSFRIIQRFQ